MKSRAQLSKNCRASLVSGLSSVALRFKRLDRFWKRGMKSFILVSKSLGLRASILFTIVCKLERSVNSASLARGRPPSCLQISLCRLTKEAIRAYMLSALSLSIPMPYSRRIFPGNSIRAYQCEAVSRQARSSTQLLSLIGWMTLPAFCAVNILVQTLPFYLQSTYRSRDRRLVSRPLLIIADAAGRDFFFRVTRHVACVSCLGSGR